MKVVTRVLVIIIILNQCGDLHGIAVYPGNTAGVHRGVQIALGIGRHAGTIAELQTVQAQE
ncbi:hypothetical protein D3C87_2001910 [compost metagenome]